MTSEFFNKIKRDLESRDTVINSNPATKPDITPSRLHDVAAKIKPDSKHIRGD